MRFFLFLLFISPVFGDSLIVVRDVKVEASGDDGLKAKEKALDLAPGVALKALARELRAQVSDESFKKAGTYVRGFKVQQEHIGDKTYAATLTYEFRPSISGALGGADVSSIIGPISAAGEEVTSAEPEKKAETPAVPLTGDQSKVLVLALYREGAKNSLWQEDNPLKSYFLGENAAYKGFSFVLPHGDAEDMADMSLSQLVQGDVEAFKKMAARYEIQNVWALIVTASKDEQGKVAGYDVVLRFVGPVSKDPVMMNVPIADVSDLKGLMGKIFLSLDQQQVQSDEKLKMQENITMTAVVNDLGAWAKMKRLIGSVEGASLKGISLKPGRVNFNIAYGADFDILKKALEEKGIALTPKGGGYAVSMKQEQDVVRYDAR